MPQPIRPKTDRELQLEELLITALSALRDLHAGYPWRELHLDLPLLEHKAEQLGVAVEYWHV